MKYHNHIAQPTVSGIATILLLAFLLSLHPLRAQDYSLGVITDYPKSVQLDSVLEIMTDQIDRTIGATGRVILDNEDISYGNATRSQIVDNYIKISQIKDFIILVGGESVKGVYNNGKFPKPTFGIGIIDPAIQGIPYNNGKSGTPNFTYIWANSGLASNLKKFQELIPYRHLTILADYATAISLQSAAGNPQLALLENTLNADISVLEVGADIGASINNIADETDAVYISNIGIRSDIEIQSLANQLIEKKLPSFSSQKNHVNQGILACLADDDSFSQLVRKLGVMVDETISGKPLQEMEVKTANFESLYINDATADALGIGLPLDIVFTSKSVKVKNGMPVYSLEDVLEFAFNKNLNIAISKQDIDLAIQDVKAARSAVIPNLDLFLNGRQINEESANNVFNNPQQLINGQLQLDQVIFSQRAIAGIKIAKYYQKAQEFLTEADILDAIFNTFSDYLNVLSAKSVLAIARENLENLEINLENATSQVESGALSVSELNRWESEVALAKQEVVEASTALSESKVRLNNRLAYALESEYDIQDITVDDQLFQQIREGILAQYVRTSEDIGVVTDFLVSEAVQSNPNKMFIVEQINAQERLRMQNQHAFYMPDLALQAQTTQVFFRGGAGSEPVEDRDFINNTWSIGVGLKYPIFARTRRSIDLQTSKIQLDQLNNTRGQIENDLELAVRSSVYQAIAAGTNIDFSKIASENAEENFESIQLRYRQGDVDITRTIDAQRAAIQAKLRYVVSVYDYLRSQIQLQYAVGFFTLFAPEEEIAEFRDRFLSYQNINPNE
jgi:outer membrane protein TolC